MIDQAEAPRPKTATALLHTREKETQRLVKLFTTMVAASLAVLALAAPAHADDNAFINDVQSQGIPMPQGPTRALAGGYTVCEHLHAGMPPQAAASMCGWMAAWCPQLVADAQRDLCPDTLH